MSRVNFTPQELIFLRQHINKCYTVYDLTDQFNAAFPKHQVTRSNLSKRLQKLGLRIGSHNIRKEKIHSRNPVGTVITDKNGKRARVKTENGYVQANAYFIAKYFGEDGKGKMLIHLNGDYGDYSKENLVLVSKSIYTMLHWRKWIFKNPELTKTAILTAELLELFPDLRHNENQYYKTRRF